MKSRAEKAPQFVLPCSGSVLNQSQSNLVQGLPKKIVHSNFNSESQNHRFYEFSHFGQNYVAQNVSLLDGGRTAQAPWGGGFGG